MMTALAFLLGLFAVEPRAAILPRVPAIFRPNEDRGNRRSRRREARLAKAVKS